MRGQPLLDEVAGYGFSTYLGEKAVRERVEDLRRGWDLHVGFGLANPASYKLMGGEPGPEPAAAQEAAEILHASVRCVAEAGRLRVGVEPAVGAIHAAGVTLTLIGAEPGDRGSALSEATREAVLSAVTTDEIPEGSIAQDGRRLLAGRAVALGPFCPRRGMSFSRPAGGPCSRSVSAAYLRLPLAPAFRKTPVFGGRYRITSTGQEAWWRTR